VKAAFSAGGRAVICLVTDGARLVGQQPGARMDDLVVAQVREAAAAGVDLVQVREPSLEGASLLRLVERCVAVASRSQTRVVVNDRLDVALAAGADGVHLKGESFAGERVRTLAPPPFLVGRSVHGVTEVASVVAGGAVDYLVAGTIFASGSKPGCTPAGAGELGRMVVAAGPIPVLAIGGVSVESASEVARAGAAGLAGIEVFMRGDDRPPLVDMVHRLRRAFDSGRGAH
jgi:thiamine-phosphate pyrophosphorylase